MNSTRSDTKQAAIWTRLVVTCALLVLIGALVAPLSTQTATDIESNLDSHDYLRRSVNEKMNPTAESEIGSSTTVTTYLPLVLKWWPPRLKVLIPLYIYPDPNDDDWDKVAAANSRVPITAIVNPNNGPGGCPPDPNYEEGIRKLREADVTVLGYVFTKYGQRPFVEVKADVELYNQCFNINGIFFDEVNSGDGKCGYYRELCLYTKSLPNLHTAFLNPGVWPDECYFSQTGCDTVVIFENDGRVWPTTTSPGYADDYSPEHSAMLAHTIPGTYTMRSMIDLALARDIGYVYVTDDTLPNPYDSLPWYWQDEIDYIASINDYHVSVLCNVSRPVSSQMIMLPKQGRSFK
jgi:hypothetical protein